MKKDSVAIKLPDGRRVIASIRYMAKAKNLTIRTDARGNIKISSPVDISWDYIKSKMAETSPKIQEMLDKTVLDKPEIPEKVEIQSIGKTITVVRKEIPQNELRYFPENFIAKISYDNDTLIIAGNSITEDILPHLHKFFQKYACRILIPFIKCVAPARENFLAFVRNQRTRMGSCSIKKNVHEVIPHISLNWRAILLPRELLRHLCMHEIAHIHQMNHSQAFYEQLERFSPDCRIMEKKLNKAWDALPKWVFYR